MTDPIPVLKITRPIPAPRARVFRAWTTPEELKAWFAPFPFTIAEARVAPKEGAEFAVHMVAPDQSRFWTRGSVAAVDPDTALTLDIAAHDAADARLFGALTEVTFKDHPMGCELFVTQTYAPEPHCPAAMFAGADIGWNTVLTQLSALVLRP